MDIRDKKIQKKLFLKYLNYIEDIKLYRKDSRIKKQAIYFFKGIDGSKNLRQKIMLLKKTKDIITEIEKF